MSDKPDEIVSAHTPQPAPPVLRLPVLPEQVWKYPRLEHIRNHALARMVSPDAVLHVVFARLASMLDPRLRVDVGRGPAQLCYYIALVGPSGSGKTSGARAGRELFPAPDRLIEPDKDGNVPYLDGVPIGSGEGIAESYMGRRDLGGKQPARAAVRQRVLLVADEGQRLTALGQRQGSTTGETLRTAWVGDTIGSRGAQEHTTREVQAGNYTLGLITGWQMGTAQALITSTDSGDAQRFVWASAIHPDISADEVSDTPGPLPNPWVAGIKPKAPGIPDGWEKGEFVITASEVVVKEVRDEHAAVQRGEIVRAPGDEHAPLHRARIAALHALLEGRRKITDDDWALSGTIWDTSRQLRDAVAEFGRRAAADDRARRDEERLTLAERTAAVVDVAPERVQRIAQRIAGYVHAEKGLTRGEARRRLRSGERHLFEAALTVAELRGWVGVGDHGITPGECPPPSEERAS